MVKLLHKSESCCKSLITDSFIGDFYEENKEGILLGAKIGLILGILLFVVFVLPNIFAEEKSFFLDSFSCGNTFENKVTDIFKKTEFIGIANVEYRCKFIVKKNSNLKERLVDCNLNINEVNDEYNFLFPLKGNLTYGDFKYKLPNDMQFLDDLNNGIGKVEIELITVPLPKKLITTFNFSCWDSENRIYSESKNVIMDFRSYEDYVSFASSENSYLYWYLPIIIPSFIVIVQFIIWFNDRNNKEKKNNQIINVYTKNIDEEQAGKERKEILELLRQKSKKSSKKKS